MKKIILIVIVILIFTFGVVFGKSWAQNSWITSAVNKGLAESGQNQNASTAAVNELYALMEDLRAI